MREHQQERQLAVYANRRHAMLWALYCLAFWSLCVLGGLLVIYYPSQSTIGAAPILVLVLAVLTLYVGWSICYFGYWAITRKPLLVADEVGIRDNGSMIGFGLIHWSEIKGIFVLTRTSTYLCIVPVDGVSLISRLSIGRRLICYLLRLKSWAPSPIVFPQTLLPVRATVLVHRLTRFDPDWEDGQEAGQATPQR